MSILTANSEIQNIVDLRNITKTYVNGELKVPVLKGIDAAVERGKFVGFIGTSGSGKSTLLNILGLLDNPTGGQYLLEGIPVESLTDYELAEIRNKKIGFIFQSFNLFPYLTVEQNIEYNFGMANPEGYRKAMRAMHLAEKWHLPVVTMVDTSGAFPGLEAEARGQAEAIGRNLMEMAALETPILTIVTGEGGSGGALGIAVGDRILMLENAVYSVISPEGCASILWRDGTKAPEAAKALHITSSDLAELKVIDGIIPEPVGGAHSHPEATMENVKAAIISNLKELEKVSASHLTENRYKKFAAIGRFN